MNIKHILFLIFILALASILRLWNLNNFPSGLNADEAAIGYNAYSLLQTGKDEYGESFPLSFKSFGDFKPGLYFYMVIPFVAILGLNEWAVRLPSALLGVGTVFMVFLLSVQLFKSRGVGIFSAFLLAVTPWHIHFSRGGWETNAATFFITLAVWLFLKSGEKLVYLFPSLLAFLAAMYIYQSPRLVVPLLVTSLLILYGDKIFHLKSLRPLELLKTNRQVIAIFGAVLLLALPLAGQFLGGGGSARFSGLSFLGDAGPISRLNELRGEHTDPGSLFAKFIHNKATVYSVEFLGHYLDHFSPKFLFINGDPLIRNNVPETGELYIIMSLMLIAGVAFLMLQDNRHKWLLFIWLFVAPLASAMTYQTPHALRAHSMVVPLSIICGLGFYKIIKLFKGRWSYLLVVILLSGIIFEGARYLEAYYIRYPKREPIAWEYGFREMVSKLEKYENDYARVVITDRYDQPYILVLFYKLYDPEKYQPQAVLSPRDKFNFGTVRSFDKYSFRPIDPREISSTPDTLFIGTEKEIPPEAKVIDKVFFPNYEEAFIFTSD